MLISTPVLVSTAHQVNVIRCYNVLKFNDSIICRDFNIIPTGPNYEDFNNYDVCLTQIVHPPTQTRGTFSIVDMIILLSNHSSPLSC